MTPETAMPLALLVPVAGAFLIWLTGSRPNLREGVTLVTAVTLFVLVLTILPHVMAGQGGQVTLVEMFPGLSLSFAIEPLGATFAVIASFLWIVTSLYSIGYMRGHGEANQTRFYIFFALALASTMGVAFAGNMLTLFTFYEALSVSTYPLVTHSGTPEARRAGRTYLGILLGTSIGFQLFAIGYTWVAAGTLDFKEGGILAGTVSDGVVVALMVLYLFGIGKAALMPFHRWLPAAMVAPTPVSALLHAVAVVKAGVFSVLKVVIYVFGLELLVDTGASLWLAYVAAATIVIASLVAMTKDNLKLRLAYSTVSQLSYVVLGAMLATTAGVVGGAMHIAMHAFGKITLFFCAGAILVASHKTEISEMGRSGPADAVHFCGLLPGLAQHHRTAADGRRLEQMGLGAGCGRDRSGDPGRRPHDLVPAQRRLSHTGRRPRLFAQRGPRQSRPCSAMGDQGGAALLCRAFMLHRCGLHRPVLLCGPPLRVS